MADAIARKNATEIRTNFILLPSQSNGLFQMKKMRLLSWFLPNCLKKYRYGLLVNIASNADATQFFTVKNAKKYKFKKMIFQG